jgi:hypothetical protein
MSDKPIIFSAESVRAILDGRKTMTRRVVKPHPDTNGKFSDETVRKAWAGGFVDVKCPYCKPGDRLWVREAWRHDGHGYAYRASCLPSYESLYTWKPSIYMPKEAARILLEVTGVRVERVQEISYDDVLQEGIEQKWTCFNPPTGGYAHENDVLEDFIKLWDSLNSKRGYGWDVNPFIWVITFRRIHP